MFSNVRQHVAPPVDAVVFNDASRKQHLEARAELIHLTAGFLQQFRCIQESLFEARLKWGEGVKGTRSNFVPASIATDTLG